MSFFETRQKVRFGHVDPAGIVYFPRIYDYVHEAFEELWEAHVGVRYYELIQTRRLGFPLVHSEVGFEHPLRFGDKPSVRITCFRLGRSSLGLCYRYYVDDVRCLEARMTTSYVDLDAMKPLPLPDEYRTKFMEIMESRENQ